MKKIDIRKNAVIYARYSSHSQNEQSIEGQLKECHNYAARNNLQVVNEYIDRAISGKTDKRVALQKLLSDSNTKTFDTLLFYKFDRFARNSYDDAIHKKHLKDNNVKIISCTEPIPDDPTGIMLEGLLVSMAEYYSAELSQKVTRGLVLNAEKGNFTGGVPPLGYKVENKKIMIDDSIAPFILDVFNMYANGSTSSEIAKYLNSNGLSTQRYKKPISINSVYRILTNKKYIGKITFGGVNYDNYPAIIPEELFSEVQIKVRTNKKWTAKSKANVEYYLSGKVFCNECGATLIGDSGTSRDGTKKYYYLCSNRKKTKTCSKKRESKEELENLVVENTINHILHPDRIKEIAKNVVESYNNNEITNLIDFNNKRKKQLEYEMEKMFDLALNSTNTNMRLKAEEKYETLEQQILDLDLIISKLTLQKGLKISEKEVINFMKKFCADTADKNFKKNILNVFVSSAIADKDFLTVYYKTSEKITPANAMAEVCSDMIAFGGEHALISEQINHYVYIDGFLGCIFRR